jgi:hypothetical protein
MPQPIWRKIVPELAIPEPGKQWRMAVPLLTVGKVMRVQVVIDTNRAPPVPGTWTPAGFAAPCTADGDFDATARGQVAQSGTLLVASAPPGALIARIGGSTADQTPDTASTPSRITFSIGRECIFTVPTTPTGSLFLGVNDDPSRMADVAGQLIVDIFEAI